MAAASTSPDQTIERITLLQGEARVCTGAQVEISTLLGSCIATCLFDPEAGVGGMNHFLLATPPAGQHRGINHHHYGVYLMQQLIDEMLTQGASKTRLRAHLYGGANLHPGMVEIGTANAEFARAFLARESIPVVQNDLGGVSARRVDFQPASGKVRCRIVAAAVPNKSDEGNWQSYD